MITTFPLQALKVLSISITKTKDATAKATTPATKATTSTTKATTSTTKAATLTQPLTPTSPKQGVRRETAAVKQLQFLS